MRSLDGDVRNASTGASSRGAISFSTLAIPTTGRRFRRRSYFKAQQRNGGSDGSGGGQLACRSPVFVASLVLIAFLTISRIVVDSNRLGRMGLTPSTPSSSSFIRMQSFQTSTTALNPMQQYPTEARTQMTTQLKEKTEKIDSEDSERTHVYHGTNDPSAENKENDWVDVRKTYPPSIKPKKTFKQLYQEMLTIKRNRGSHSFNITISPHVVGVVANMSLEEMVGQMCQLNIHTLLNMNNYTINKPKLRALLSRHVGSFLNTPFAGSPLRKRYGFNLTQWRNVIDTIQQVAAEVGTLPPLYGIDHIHGANYILNATLFPHQINAAATFNTDLVYQMGQVTSAETIAAGMTWIFGPVLGIAARPEWARFYETFGEDPYLVSEMGAHLIRGLQASGKVAACMKHFIGYSNPIAGHDRASSLIADRQLLNYYVPSFQAAIRAGVRTAMEGYNSINGEPVVSSKKLLKHLLRDDMKFHGMLVTDWGEINNLVDWHRSVSRKSEATELVLKQTSVDMSMVASDTSFIDYTIALVKNGKISRERIVESAERIVQLKHDLGLLKNSMPGEDEIQHFGSTKHRQLALKAAHESMVLLQNRRLTLPFSPGKQNVLVTGPLANQVGYLCGGWTVLWHGTTTESVFYGSPSIFQAIQTLNDVDAEVKDEKEEERRKENTWNATISQNESKNTSEKEKHTQKKNIRKTNHTVHAMGVNVFGEKAYDYDLAMKYARSLEYDVVVVLGEPTYAEKQGDVEELALNEGQQQYVLQLQQTGARVVVVLVQGRPRLLRSEVVAKAHAILHAMLPCSRGGEAIADVLFGVVNPSGRLPFTYPRTSLNSQIPYFHMKGTTCRNAKPCKPQWTFGHGLSYSTFQYTQFEMEVVHKPQLVCRLRLQVTNTGERFGGHSVLIFVRQPYRRASEPEEKLLKAFQKVYLQPRETKTITFVLDAMAFSFLEPRIGHGFHRVVESGYYFINVGHNVSCPIYSKSGSSTRQSTNKNQMPDFSVKNHPLCKRLYIPQSLYIAESLLTTTQNSTLVNDQSVFVSSALQNHSVYDFSFDLERLASSKKHESESSSGRALENSSSTLRSEQ